MQRRQRTHGLLGTAAAAVLLAMTLGLAGCGSDGDDGAQGPPGPPGQDAVTVTDAAFGVDSPNASVCYSCHQNRDDLDLVRGHIDALGGEMYGFATHLDFEGQEGCTSCHSGLRPDNGPDGLAGLRAGENHQTNRPDGLTIRRSGESIPNAVITDVTGEAGILTVVFELRNFESDQVNAEFTIAKWNEDKGAWINLFKRDRQRTGGAPVIRADNLREVVAGTRNANDLDTTFTYTFPPNLTEAPVWRGTRTGNPDPQVGETYCAATDAECAGFVQGIIDGINADGTWEGNATYRIGITGRPGTDEVPFIRFGVAADVVVEAGAVTAHGAPAPTNQIAQTSCNTCHGDRLDFQRLDDDGDVSAVHGQLRPVVAVCSNCHNPYTYDRTASTAEAGGWVDLSANTMIHKIHTGIEGYAADGRPYEDVNYPDFTLAGNSNCASCHNATEDGFGGGWDLAAGNLNAATACATCHGTGGVPINVGFHGVESEDGRTGNCAQCHDGSVVEDGFKQTPDAYHGVTARLEELRIQREEFAFSLVSVEDAVYEGTPVVQWQVLDGEGNPYNLANGISIDGGPRLHIGWGYRDDWTNEGSGEKSAFRDRDNDDNGRPVALNVATTGDDANTVVSADGLTAISTFPRLTDDEAGKGLPFANLEAAEEGRRGFVAIHRRVSDNGTIRQITSVVQPITLGSGEVEFAPARRNTVDATFGVETGRRGTGCLDCHGTITAHGGGYIMDGDVQACITCHNAGSHQSRNVAAIRGQEPQSVDFMYFMHDLHGVGLVSVDDGEGLFPQNMAARCHSCHAGGSERAGYVDGNVDGFMNPAGQSNCNLCHDGAVNPGRLGVLSDWPRANSRYGLRGDGTDGE